MRYCYFDSSALTKAYALERGTKQVRDLLRSARTDPPTVRALVSSLSGLEVISAIQRKLERREITRSVAERLVKRVGEDFSAEPPPDAFPLLLVALSAPVIQHGQGLMTVHRLRTYDALHLASALAARQTTPVGARFVFVCADRDLCAAAAAENLDVLDPEA